MRASGLTMSRLSDVRVLCDAAPACPRSKKTRCASVNLRQNISLLTTPGEAERCPSECNAVQGLLKVAGQSRTLGNTVALWGTLGCEMTCDPGDAAGHRHEASTALAAIHCWSHENRTRKCMLCSRTWIFLNFFSDI